MGSDFSIESAVQMIRRPLCRKSGPHPHPLRTGARDSWRKHPPERRNKEWCRSLGVLPTRMRDSGWDQLPPDVRFAGDTCRTESSALDHRLLTEIPSCEAEHMAAPTNAALMRKVPVNPERIRRRRARYRHGAAALVLFAATIEVASRRSLAPISEHSADAKGLVVPQERTCRTLAMDNGCDHGSRRYCTCECCNSPRRLTLAPRAPISGAFPLSSQIGDGRREKKLRRASTQSGQWGSPFRFSTIHTWVQLVIS